VWNYGPSYPASGVTDPTHTWWQKTVDTLGAERLVNNSWSGDKIVDRALKGRATQLHDDTGANAGELPDIIFIYLGTNDFSAVGASVGSVASLTVSDIAAKAENANYTPASVAEAYAVMLYRIKAAYPDAEIYCLNVIEKPNVNVASLAQFNDGLLAATDLFEDVYAVDIFRNSGIHDDANFDYYVPGNRLHPGENGMRAISKVLLDVIFENSRYMPEGFNELLHTEE
jgi:lysophospholipase L1-like esterase